VSHLIEATHLGLMSDDHAGNIVVSNAYPRHLDMLLRLLSSSDAHTTNICYLILRSLLKQLSGEHQVDAAQRILSSMGIQSLDVFQGVMANATALQEVSYLLDV
jgi:U3 small nucleolar RNA-associated protein 10